MRTISSQIESELVSKNISIGEYSIIRPGVVLGQNVVIHPHVIINAGVTIGDNVEIFPGAVIGREPKGAGAISRKPDFEFKVNIGAGCSIGPHAIIYYDVEIGENTLLGDGASIREKCRIGSYCVIARYVSINYNTVVGNHTKIMDQTHITGNCKIGNHVFISTMVGTANDNAGGRKGYNEEAITGPTVEDHVFVGLGASLLPGVKIGHHATVGAGSVVTKDVPPEVRVMGIPARIK